MTEATRMPIAVRGPTTARERSLAPDLARGTMLLLIALANSALYLYGRAYGPRQHLAEGSDLDHAWTLVQMTLVDGRAYPMFAALFGYGMVQLLERQRAAGTTFEGTQSLLRRRSLWLVVFGFVHALLLFPGDILGTYGLAGLMVVLVLQATDRRLVWTAAVFAALTVVIGASFGLTPVDAEARYVVVSLAQPDYLAATGLRLGEWALTALIQVLLVFAPIMLGVWAARRRLLDEPGRHRRFLRWAAAVGIGVAILGGLPLALSAAGMWEPTIGAQLVIGSLHTIAGTAGGLGYAALVGLVAAALHTRRGPVVTALAACGERSLSCYLAQSVVFVLVLTPYAGGLGGTLGSASVAVLAVATWAVTVVLADVLRRGGRRGPAEVLLRRLTYRRTATGSAPAAS